MAQYYTIIVLLDITFYSEIQYSVQTKHRRPLCRWTVFSSDKTQKATVQMDSIQFRQNTEGHCADGQYSVQTKHRRPLCRWHAMEIAHVYLIALGT
jgi:hypothetical protein